MRAWLWIFGVAGSCLLSTSASGQAPSGEPDGNKTLARQWANKAQDRFDAEDYQGAIDSIHEAQKHARPPTFTLLDAQAHVKLGKLLAAQDLYQSIVDLKIKPGAPAAWSEAQRSAKTELGALGPRIPKLEIAVPGVDLTTLSITLDGAPFEIARLGQALPQDPGKHSVVIEPKGHDKVVRTVVLKEGATQRLKVELSELGGGPASSATAKNTVSLGPLLPPSPALVVSRYATFGLAGAGLIAGAITGGMVLGQLNNIAQPCRLDIKTCSSRAQGGVESVGLLGDISTASFVVAGAAAAAGLVLVLLPRSRAPQVGITVGPGSVAVRGTFQ